MAARPPRAPAPPVRQVTAERPQDEGRRHRRKGAPSAATASLLADYQAAMRAELRGILVDLAGVPPAPGLGLMPQPPQRPALPERMRLWELAIKIGRELGTEVDATPTPAEADAARPRPSRRRVDYG